MPAPDEVRRRLGLDPLPNGTGARSPTSGWAERFGCALAFIVSGLVALVIIVFLLWLLVTLGRAIG